MLDRSQRHAKGNAVTPDKVGHKKSISVCKLIFKHLAACLFLRPHIKDIFQSIAAKVGTGEPCCDWVSGVIWVVHIRFIIM